MRRISISELQNNPTKALEELPVELIRYGQTVAFIVPPEGTLISAADKNFLEKSIENASGTEEAALGLVPDGGTATEQQFLPEFTPGFCTKCYKKAEVKEVTYNDADGNKFKEMLCAKHVKKLEAFIKKEL